MVHGRPGACVLVVTQFVTHAWTPDCNDRIWRRAAVDIRIVLGRQVGIAGTTAEGHNASMEHYVRPDEADEPAPMRPEPKQPLLRRVARWLATLLADREPSRRSSFLIRNQDGTSRIINPPH